MHHFFQRHSIPLKTTLAGIAFGSLFPLIAEFIGPSPEHLFLVICTAPLILGIFAYGLGLSSHKAAQLESSAQYLKVLETMGDGLIIQNLEGEILEHNSTALQILGAQPDGLIGSTLQNTSLRLIHKNHDPFDPKDLPSSIAGASGLPVLGAIVGIQANHSDKIRWIQINAAPLKKERKILTVSIFSDITRQMEMESQLELEKEKSLHNAKLALLGELSAGVAHEINNPLAIICSSISLLEKFRDTPEKFSAKLDAIQRASFRIQRIVRGLKKFSRSSERKQYTHENLGNILSEACILTEAKSKKYSTPVTIEQQPGLNLLCDGVEIEQVLINLINNAIDAVKTQTEKWVHIKSFTDKNHIIIQVIDSGLGLPTEIESKLFQPFFTTKAVGEGTGLGLSISKGILDEHQATILVNRNSKNTCFEIRFPNPEALQTAS